MWQANGQCGSVEDLQAKLKNVSAALASWGSKEFGNVRHEQRELKKRLQVLRSMAGRVGPSDEEIKIEAHIVELNFREEIMWR